MLVLPDRSTPFRVLGIDPGSTTLGVSILDHALDTASYTVVDAFTLTARESDRAFHQYTETHTFRLARLQSHHRALVEVLMDYRPHAVICEAPFMGRFAAAFQALSECVLMIQQALLEYDPFLPLWRVEPTPAKAAAGVDIPLPGSKVKLQKDDVRVALSRQTDMVWQVPLAELDEHAVDATAVGLYYLKELLY